MANKEKVATACDASHAWLNFASPPWMHSQVNELTKFPLSHGLALKVLSCKAGGKMVSAKSSKIRSEKNVCLPMIPRSNLYQILRGGRASLKNMPYSQEESGTLKTSLISENFCLFFF